MAIRAMTRHQAARPIGRIWDFVSGFVFFTRAAVLYDEHDAE
jgi:hypothetical protein